MAPIPPDPHADRTPAVDDMPLDTAAPDGRPAEPVDPEPQVHHEQRKKRHRRTKAEMQKAREAQASAETEVHKTVMA